MEQTKDITTTEDIQLLVDRFYGEVQLDPLLGPIFAAIIQDRWPEHLEKMYRFWQTVLLDEHTYDGRPFPPHARLPVEQSHFDHWLEVWHATIDELFSGAKAEEAKWRGHKMATLFLSKIMYYRGRPGVSLL